MSCDDFVKLKNKIPPKRMEQYMKPRGIMYVATGEMHLREMLFSAASAKKHFPNLPIALFTDTPENPMIRKSGLIDDIKLINNPLYNFGDKIRPLQESPYLETLFLDTDTIIVENCDEIFEPLKHNDIAVAFHGYRTDYSFEELPKSCPSYNTGVIVFKRSAEFDAFIDSWSAKQEEYSRIRPDDQPSFRYCANQGKIKLHTLPNEYNFYTFYPSVVGGLTKVKIVHGCGPYAEEIAKLLNKSSERGPVIYGSIHLKVILHWYWTKIRKVIRRWTGRRWR